MTEQGLIEASRLMELSTRTKESLYRYPAIDAQTFRRAVEEFFKDQQR